ncbi:MULTISPECIES: SCO family protein [Tritonibacter]|uniref:SCO family protein n=1 Tax=Tritonibacter TaxID=2083206 RepID=UPI0009C178B7|nr:MULTISPECIES: SCO family protein [Tritonibacter]MCZ4266500.1 SCO family protein [Rhodobacteraceae bacterium G21628-S1]NKX29441.1 SCO family protein [Rhodobacteraceae bacterium R_SAG6]
MTTIRRKYLVIGVLWGLALLALIPFTWSRWGSATVNDSLANSIGPGDYRLTTTSGAVFTEDTLKDGPTAVFFGFTHCPEVCPTSLGDIAAFQDELGPEEQIRVYFVTVDPERDQLDQLRDYVTWAPGVEGVSGSREEIDKAIRAFRIYARKVPLEDGGYTMDHSANILLFDQNGRFFEPIGYQEETDRAVEKIRRMSAL